MYITGRMPFKAVTMEDVTDEELGGARSTPPVRGGDFSQTSEDVCLGEVRRLLSFLPANNLEDPHAVDSGDDLSGGRRAPRSPAG